MEEIKHVTQYTPKACVYACLEMVSFGLMSQREIHQQMKSFKDDSGLFSESRQLVRMGLLPLSYPTGEILIGKVMLVTVPSLNIEGGNHRVVIDTRDEHELFDPNFGRDKSVKLYDPHMQNLCGFSEITVIEYCNEVAT